MSLSDMFPHLIGNGEDKNQMVFFVLSLYP